jgi:ABC-type branched-subunit amino acid transport system ATPase component
MAVPFLEVESLTKSFGGLKAVDSVRLRMEQKEVLGLIGPNGAGKTTLLRLLTGILKPDSGSVRFKGTQLIGKKTWDIVNMGVACTFQNMRPFRRLPIIANVMVSCLSPRSMKRGEWVKVVEAKAMDALEFAGISDMALEKASTLSQGDLKRLEVARAVATDPDLLLLDEPFGGLSPPKGSSRRSSSGSVATARATSNRFRSPWERVEAFSRAISEMPANSRASMALASTTLTHSPRFMDRGERQETITLAMMGSRRKGRMF